jgi:hypothetical protein
MLARQVFFKPHFNLFATGTASLRALFEEALQNVRWIG